jgi:NAD(P)-dependent dehydrogenase (short-subunit alcohol dehydrogenase family)
MESLQYFAKEGSFKGKNIVITGANGGVGSIVAETLLQCGARVIAVGRNEKKILAKFEKYIKDKRYNFGYELINLEDPAGINRGFKSVMLKLKGKIDSLIFCHGKFVAGKIADATVDVFDSTLNVNVRSCFHLLSIATPFLKISKGNVVAVSSVEAKIPVKESFVNSLSKTMLNSLIECSALELAPFGVRVNGVAPAITATNIRVAGEFTETQNQEFLEQMGSFFLLNKEVRIVIKFSKLLLFKTNFTFFNIFQIF